MIYGGRSPGDPIDQADIVEECPLVFVNHYDLDNDHQNERVARQSVVSRRSHRPNVISAKLSTAHRAIGGHPPRDDGSDSQDAHRGAPDPLRDEMVFWLPAEIRRTRMDHPSRGRSAQEPGSDPARSSSYIARNRRPLNRIRCGARYNGRQSRKAT